MAKKLTLITLIIIALAVVGVLAYQKFTPTKEAEVPEAGQEPGNREPGMIKTQEAPTTPEFSEIDTSNWETYRNEKYGFELKYPNTWSLSEKIDKGEVQFFDVTSSQVMNIVISEGISLRDFLNRDPNRYVIKERKMIDNHQVLLGYETYALNTPPDIALIETNNYVLKVQFAEGFRFSLLLELMQTLVFF